MPPKQTEPAYTSPTIRLEDGTFVVDSKVISVELEKRYPEPSLYLDAPELEEVYTQFPIAFRPIIPVIYPGIIHHVVQPDDADHLRKGVEQRHGKSVEAVQTEDGGEPAWEAARESFKGLEDVVKRKGGPFVLGKERESRFYSLLFSKGKGQWCSCADESTRSFICRLHRRVIAELCTQIRPKSLCQDRRHVSSFWGSVRCVRAVDGERCLTSGVTVALFSRL